ncbi:MAG: AbrB/MazE/SpoVT family DNA-binding domain-containing protein [Cetobacterium sp.]|uniref:AbrB/MazE/SpoVT family DNA-binding domain-containing protein n=1 Tax=Cetobacterium sp. TaxID=2071632 RepID=UPI003F30AE55
MENKTLKIILSKGGTGYITPKIALPKSWIDKLGITLESREVNVTFDENNGEIIIRKK